MKFAILGAGAIAGLRRRAIDVLDWAECTAIFDLDAARAEALAGGARVARSAEEVFSDAGVDAVVVCTPPNVHAELAIAALEAGKHVLVEKPMANSVAACRRIVDAAEAAGRVLTVGFNHRYFPAVREVRKAVASGAIGRLSYVRGFAGHTGLSEFKSPWMYDKDVMGGGALFDNGIHMTDLVRHMMGEVETVYGRALDDVWGLDRVEDTAFALLNGPDGIVGSLNASWTEWRGYHFFVEAYGSHGMARASYAPMRSTVVTMDRPGGRAKRRENFYPRRILREKLRGWQSSAIDTLAAEMTDFRALVEGRAPEGPIATAADGLAAVAIADAVYRADAAGAPVAPEI